MMTSSVLKQTQIGVLGYACTDCSATPGAFLDRWIEAMASGITAAYISPPESLIALAARLKEAHGGRSIVLTVVGQEVLEEWAFEALFVVKDKNAALDLAVSSSVGIVGFPTNGALSFDLGELRNLPIPLTVLSSEPIPDTSGAGIRRSFANPGEAVRWVQGSSSATTHSCANVLFQSGLEIVKANYPHGEKGLYLSAAARFRAAVLATDDRDNALRQRAQAFYYEALGDHAYYHQEDFFGAAALYQQSHRTLSRAVGDLSDCSVPRFLREVFPFDFGVKREAVRG
jgi:hypothetical protein